MKTSSLFLSAALILATGPAALADEYLECHLIGQSDAASVTQAPAHVGLDLARDWTLTEDGRTVRPIRVRDVLFRVTVTYSRQSPEGIIDSTYVFNDRLCESQGVGSAVLKRTLVSGSMSSGPNHVVSYYECTCGVD